MHDYQPLRIAEVRRETPEAISVTLADPRSAARRVPLQAGPAPARARQHRRRGAAAHLLDLLRARRAPACASPSSAWPTGASPTGPTTRWRPAARSRRCRRPGASCCPRATGAPRHVVAFAAGAGITPILAMIKHALATEPATSFTLVYGNRSPDSIMFRRGAGGPEGPLPRPLHAAQRALAQRGVAARRCSRAASPARRSRRSPRACSSPARWRTSSCAGRAR